MRFFSVGIGLAAGTFAHQYFGDANWTIAIDRTFFQTAAVIACWIVSLMPPAMREGGQ